jgi:hypothetical protein
MVMGIGDASAQSFDPAAVPAPAWSIGPFLGVARHSPAGHHLGLTPDRNHLFVGLRAARPLSRRRAWRLDLAPEAALLVVSNNPTYVTVDSGDRAGPVTIEGHHRPVAGLAFSPIGLESVLSAGRRWELFTNGAVGGVWFTRQVPVLGARAFNFTFEVGGGLMWRTGPATRVRFGYMFHHLSNAHTAYQNPGIDAHVLVFGFERTLTRRPHPAR